MVQRVDLFLTFVKNIMCSPLTKILPFGQAYLSTQMPTSIQYVCMSTYTDHIHKVPINSYFIEHFESEQVWTWWHVFLISSEVKKHNFSLQFYSYVNTMILLEYLLLNNLYIPEIDCIHSCYIFIILLRYFWILLIKNSINIFALIFLNKVGL